MNFNRPFRRSSKKASSNRGFAIVMALSLLSLVFLLVISLVNLVGIDLTLGDARKERVLAQAHARMGMMVAIGEIQKHLGPDTRVSATADILDERIERHKKYEDIIYKPDTSGNIGSLIPLNQAIDLNEDDALDVVPFGQRYWTGVWKHRARRKGVLPDLKASKPLPKNTETGTNIDGSPAPDTEYDHHPAVEVAWLVSGNEGWNKKLAYFAGGAFAEFVEIPDGISPKEGKRDFVNGGIYGKEVNAWKDYQNALDKFLKNYDHPLNNLPDPEESDDVVWMLKKPLLDHSFDPKMPDTWKEHLRGEPVKVRKTRISSGAYAYWVDDEGVKSKINTVSPLKDEGVARVLNRPDYEEIKKTVTLEPNSNKGSFDLTFVDTNPDAPLRKLKHSSLQMLAKDEEIDLKREDKHNKLASYRHSITGDSFGLLTDTRTGGLRRDLSLAFANDEDWGKNNLEILSKTESWARDFLDYIYRDRIRYIKDIPLDPDAKANVWHVRADTQTLDDFNAIIAGPFWSLLGSFHNLYNNLTEEGGISNEHIDRLPRISGDNYVVFNSGDGEEPAGAKPFWTEDSIRNLRIPKNEAIALRLNYFRKFHQRPGPKKHGIQPVLMEVKYSHIPVVKDGFLSLAMYPSVALWNPYNVDLKMDELFIEIPIENVQLKAFNPKDLDKWRKWYMFAFNFERNPNGGGGVNPNYPPKQPPLPRPPTWPRGGRGPIGLSGEMGLSGLLSKNFFYNIRQPTPFEPSLRGSDVPPESFFNKVLRSPELNQKSVQFRSFYERGEYVPNRDQHFMKRPGLTYETASPCGQFVILETKPAIDLQTQQQYQEQIHRHLLLKISGLHLTAGEKAHYTVSHEQTWDFVPIKDNIDLDQRNSKFRQFLEVTLKKGNDDFAFICKTELPVDEAEPLLVRYELGDVIGVDPSQGLSYKTDADLNEKIDLLEAPKGITLYSESPSSTVYDIHFYQAKALHLRKPIFKLNNTFNFNNHGVIGSSIASRWHLVADPNTGFFDPIDNRGDFMPGNGFRIRYQLPGNSDKIVFEQFNVRAFVNSQQEGGGHNWKHEKFEGSLANGVRPHIIFNSNNLPIKTYTHDVSFTDIEGNEITGKISFSPTDMKFFDIWKLSPKFNNSTSFDTHISEETINPLSLTELAKLPAFFDQKFNPSDPFNLTNPRIPRISSYSNNIGYFHDRSGKHGGEMERLDENIKNACLFEVPSSPMLSILQLRHANFSDYSHSPTYILGNSYATSQVGRYKSWGRMRAISKVINSAGFRVGENERHHGYWIDEGLPANESPWAQYKAHYNLYFPGGDKNYGPLRDPDAQIDHQNTTLDHSYYANHALLDGYFMSGFGFINSVWKKKSKNMMDQEMKKLYEDKSKSNIFYTPFRNTRMRPYWDNGQIRDTSYSDKSELVQSNEDEKMKFQTMAADILVEGAFNINSTSVDAWISQLSSHRNASETPFPRFINHPSSNSWNQIRSLTDDEIELLALCLVEQIKLRGPFLSYSDFVNRRLIGPKLKSSVRGKNHINTNFEEWDKFFYEDRDTTLGLRGAVQAAIAEAEINQDSFKKTRFDGDFYATSNIGEWHGKPGKLDNPMIPYIPLDRLNDNREIDTLTIFGMEKFNFKRSSFGLHAISRSNLNQQNSRDLIYAKFPPINPQNPQFGREVFPSKYGIGKKFMPNPYGENYVARENIISFKLEMDDFDSALEFGEAPDNLLAVENVATAANKPGWLMQSDVLSPLAPVTSARSDTFKIRVMGERRGSNSSGNQSRAWIEVTVQRLPDYVKPELDAPHHRPHEPFEDKNFNGYWDPDFDEHWLDLNQNGTDSTGGELVRGAVPDLPGVGASGKMKFFADGLYSDLKLNKDLEEEPEDTTISRMGINQRFGRKFRIIKFRWIKDQDV